MLRKSTTDSALARRAKDLVKRWRDLVNAAPVNNGQVKANDSLEETSRKRAAPPDSYDRGLVKRVRFMNGQANEIDLSDNSNSSFADVGLSRMSMQRPNIVNSDSNSSIPDNLATPDTHAVQQQQPKKRGRKKGSKNHKNLIEEAETSFSNKLNVSRGNAKVKTTQELLADLHIRTVNNMSNNKPPMEDLNERAAKLTERVSMIDRKLNANSTRYNKKLSYKLNMDRSESFDSGVVHNVKREEDDKNDDVIIVDEPDVVEEEIKVEDEVAVKEESATSNIPKSLSVEEALLLLPPIDKSVLLEEDPEPKCTCQLIENEVENVTETGDVIVSQSYEFVEDENCASLNHLIRKYKLNDEELSERVKKLHDEYLPNINGNCSAGCCTKKTQMSDDGLYLNVVPNVNTDNLFKFNDVDNEKPASENFKKYSISENGTPDEDCVAKNDELLTNKCENSKFSEWHEVLETPSYNGETLKILPYVIID